MVIGFCTKYSRIHLLLTHSREISPFHYVKFIRARGTRPTNLNELCTIFFGCHIIKTNIVFIWIIIAFKIMPRNTFIFNNEVVQRVFSTCQFLKLVFEILIQTIIYYIITF